MSKWETKKKEEKKSDETGTKGEKGPKRRDRGVEWKETRREPDRRRHRHQHAPGDSTLAVAQCVRHRALVQIDANDFAGVCFHVEEHRLDEARRQRSQRNDFFLAQSQLMSAAERWTSGECRGGEGGKKKKKMKKKTNEKEHSKLARNELSPRDRAT